MRREKIFSVFFLLMMSLISALICSGCGKAGDEDVLTLRICNWEEYIDEGDWAEDEVIELDDTTILGANSMIDDFTEWYYETTGKKVKVEYSCFGTNEELYNQLTLGDEFDLVCPSEYMIMKLLAEDKLMPYSDEFFDATKEENYYIRGVAPYIYELASETTVNDESLERYAAGYMWGTTGIVYNPEEVSKDDVKHWNVLIDSDFKRQITIKDNVRDSFFAAVGILKSELLLTLAADAAEANTDEAYEAYNAALRAEMNDSSDETIQAVEYLLQDNKDNFYAFETDSGKADMITGKVVANYQWSGDAVYTLDQAEEDDFTLCYSVPEEGSNLWFDGWVMLKDGIGKDAEKQAVAEAFVNFVSMPENAVRNMYYIGYTSAITGAADDDTVFQYANWCYGAEDDDADTIEYDLTYFFAREGDENSYIITAPADQANRQLFAQYPTQDVLKRCVIMEYFGDVINAKLNQMWINVRCFNPFR
ncbi:MAG: extracellular solute-binding protein [Lachnospiraceae bacterium]|nr:extracellular solute-binding protein [Lachnospiraceae bacterium]